MQLQVLRKCIDYSLPNTERGLDDCTEKQYVQNMQHGRKQRVGAVVAITMRATFFFADTAGFDKGLGIADLDPPPKMKVTPSVTDITCSHFDQHCFIFDRNINDDCCFQVLQLDVKAWALVVFLFWKLTEDSPCQVVQFAFGRYRFLLKRVRGKRLNVGKTF